MRICVFGAGALGSAIGGLLARNHEVVLVGRRAHVNAVKARGLQLLGDARMRVRVDAVENLARIAPTDLVILTTKAYDTGDAVVALKEWADDRTLVLTLQNGLGNLEQLRRWKGRRAFGGVTTMGATLLGPGQVRISGLGRTAVGSDSDPRGARIIADAFASAGIPASTESDIFRTLWSKAVVSACINPTTAVLGVTNGRLLESRVIRKLLADISTECVAVAAQEGVSLEARELTRRVMNVARDTAKNRSSMLQDIEKGKRTEIHQINGAFAALGDKHRIPTPLNDVLTALIEALERRPRTQKG
ncbi:MAG: 2-dehydropantoate 2-reductase [Thermoplasmata archaeon]|jgi:2-dehydropantoate 2-reductase|nr:2-dehydropantoate 2-reductase [Thermoplasmata archaeon]